MRILKRHTYFLDVSGTGLEQLPGSLSSSSLCCLRHSASSLALGTYPEMSKGH